VLHAIELMEVNINKHFDILGSGEIKFHIFTITLSSDEQL
jgi:hypothetical protein